MKTTTRTCWATWWDHVGERLRESIISTSWFANPSGKGFHFTHATSAQHRISVLSMWWPGLQVLAEHLAQSISDYFHLFLHFHKGNWRKIAHLWVVISQGWSTLFPQWARASVNERKILVFWLQEIATNPLYAENVLNKPCFILASCLGW